MGLSLNVRRLRKGAGLTQEQLAEQVGVSQPAIAQIETGKIKNPGVDVLIALAGALGKSVDDLVRDGEPEQAQA